MYISFFISLLLYTRCVRVQSRGTRNMQLQRRTTDTNHPRTLSRLVDRCCQSWHRAMKQGLNRDRNNRLFSRGAKKRFIFVLLRLDCMWNGRKTEYIANDNLTLPLVSSPRSISHYGVLDSVMSKMSWFRFPEAAECKTTRLWGFP